MRRWKLLVVLLLMAMPASAQSSKPRFLPDSDRMCKANLADGTPYEVWDRVFVTQLRGQPLYVKVRAHYRPGSGEFVWRSTGLSEKGYASELKENPNKAGASCEELHHLLLLQDGEWADFWAWNGRVEVFHCNLRFKTREKAWSHVAIHWQDAPESAGPAAKWVVELLLYHQLGYDFFRPKRLEFDARPYTYDSLSSAKKVHSNWELEIKGADEPNRATVILDSNFKLLAVTKNSAAH